MSAAIYTGSNAVRTNSNSNSPGNAHTHGSTPAALLVVPQPINATKITNGTGSGRKYSCKMCPTVSYNFMCCFYLSNIFLIDLQKKKSNAKRNQVGY